MVLKIYIIMTSISGNNAIRKKQQTILDALDVRNIEYSVVDVSAPENEQDKSFMREKARPRQGVQYPLPPQIFYDDEYLGDYDSFAESLEDNCVEVFFKQAPPVRKVAPDEMSPVTESIEKQDDEENEKDKAGGDEEEKLAIEEKDEDDGVDKEDTANDKSLPEEDDDIDDSREKPGQQQDEEETPGPEASSDVLSDEPDSEDPLLNQTGKEDKEKTNKSSASATNQAKLSAQDTETEGEEKIDDNHGLSVAEVGEDEATGEEEVSGSKDALEAENKGDKDVDKEATGTSGDDESGDQREKRTDQSEEGIDQSKKSTDHSEDGVGQREEPGAASDTDSA